MNENAAIGICLRCALPIPTMGEDGLVYRFCGHRCRMLMEDWWEWRDKKAKRNVRDAQAQRERAARSLARADKLERAAEALRAQFHPGDVMAELAAL
ncbi:hypothetical protein [Pengzhenrongella sicca]|uniref:Uncharacterized protein n=1 Tax=Pengzhenrongella sicca TaxID=2819238 RepID=A0A8A4ZEM2_9MICO|nr:hypothetical protein [Pengzhenrongella sicca]QTE30430.1 hypothetical protein J4E96_05420 [Pengzhenrongella sicca]